MEFSLAGALVCCALLTLGLCLRSPITIALFASIPFSATAFVTLTAFGGSSPLIYTVFVLILLAFAASRPRVLDELSILFNRHWIPWIVLFLTIYVVAGGFILPRLFMGQTTVLVAIRGLVSDVSLIEMPLAPMSGNFTQSAYFTLGALTFYAFCLLMRERSGFDSVLRGFLVFASVQVALGAIDIGSKLAGLGDVLAPIRSATYAMLTHQEVAGFWRIVGGASEASTFAAVSLPCLAFVGTYWRATGSRIALLLTLALLGLLLLSTSSTAYVTLAILALFLAVHLLHSIFANRLLPRDMVIIAFMMVGLALLIVMFLANEKLFDPFTDLLNLMVFDKLSSGSGLTRAYWNARSLQSFVDTAGLGVGMGSSRSSSWVVSVLSELGIIGALMIGTLVVFLLRGMRGLEGAVDSKHLITANSARAAGLTSLLTSSISGGLADPGLLFFIALAVWLSCREEAQKNQELVDWRMACDSVHYRAGRRDRLNVGWGNMGFR